MSPLVGVGKQGGTAAVPIKSECCGFFIISCILYQATSMGRFLENDSQTCDP